MNFLDMHKSGMETLGFWTEEFRSSVITAIESRYKTEIIKEYFIEDFTINSDKVLVKWKKRFQPLDKQQLKDKYGR